MKKNLLLAAAALLLSIVAFAGPAKPGPIVYTQPDGTTVTLYLHGDEYYHWMTDENGNEVILGDDNYVQAVEKSIASPSRMTLQEANLRRAQNMELMKAAASSSHNVGEIRIPVLLIGFSDVQITKTTDQFDAMLNTPGYTDNGAIGSVYDYFYENSFGQFRPKFDVLKPEPLSNPVSTYGGNNDRYAYKALVEACDLLDSTVDFSQYDNDGDGYIDFIIFYFAGYDEAQCPSGGTYSNYIWSHASDISTLKQKYDGVTLANYFCTSELKNYTGSTMCSIGPTCHEFAHTLGLPDFYDVAYQENSSSTQAANTYSYDLMASGSYNSNSTTPPYLNAEELLEIGWLDAIPEITTSGSYTLQPLNYPGADTYSAYMTKTSVSNEYFVYETRSSQRWDAGLPGHGLLVFHVDKSTNRVSGSITAASVWNSNAVNSYAAHPCCYVVPAPNPTQTSLYSGSLSYMVFGSASYRTFSPTDWSGNATGFQFSAITYSGGKTTFSVSNSNTLGITGHVWDSDGNPISGATISIDPGVESSAIQKKNDSPFQAFAKKIFLSSKSRNAARTRATTSYTVTTDSEGFYSVELETAGTYNVTAAREGYVSRTAIVSVTSVIESQDFYLMREGEEAPSLLIPFPQDEDGYIVGASINSIIGQNKFPVSEIGKYAGKQIKSISFYLYGESETTFDDVYAIIDFEQERKATVRVADEDVTMAGWTTVDLRDQELLIPSNADIYAGVGINNWGFVYNGAYFAFGGYYLVDEDEDGNEYVPDWAVDWPYRGYVAEYNLTSTGDRYDWELVFTIYLTIGDYEAPDTGYNVISDPQGGKYAAGDILPLVLLETDGTRKPGSAISWFFDDEPVSAASVTLPAGEHVVQARFTTTDGKTKVVELELTVQ